MKLRILIADDHDVLRIGVRTLIERIDGAEIVGEACNGRAAVDQARSLMPDVVLMDIVMPELNGIDAGRQIRAGGTGIKLIALSARSDRQIVLEAIHAGFVGFLSKCSVGKELELALRAVSSGKTYLSPTINDVVIANYVRSVAGDQPIAPSPLTVREREVLQHVAEGLTSKEISRLLHVSQKTIETHRLQIMDKLDIHSIACLTKYAVRHGISPSE
jgi:DNA-binding NarL/FixJ family response regulator